MTLYEEFKENFNVMLKRYDENPLLFYFSPKDFLNLKVKDYDITTSDVTLKGYFYYYNEFNPEKIVIFDHGLGGGHYSYFKEIELIARNGYTVFSYDHKGCMESGGEGIMSFSQGIKDIDDVLNTFQNDKELKNRKIKLIGHSRGGYSVMNVAQFHKNITHIVSIAGFLTAKSFAGQFIPEEFKNYIDIHMENERQINPLYADMDAISSLKKTDAKLFYIQSKDDKIVKYDIAFIPLYSALKERKDSIFLSLENKNHLPHYTIDAVKAGDELFAQSQILAKENKVLTKEQQDKFRNKFDWNLITKQDEKIWNKIFDFLEK